MPHERVSIDPLVMVGKPVIRGTRLTVEMIVRHFAHGWSMEELLYNYPALTREDVQAALAYAADQLPGPAVAAE